MGGSDESKRSALRRISRAVSTSAARHMQALATLRDRASHLGRAVVQECGRRLRRARGAVACFSDCSGRVVPVERLVLACMIILVSDVLENELGVRVSVPRRSIAWMPVSGGAALP